MNKENNIACWQCEKDITNQLLPKRFVNWIPHCNECYQDKIRWSEEIRNEKCQ